jgi:hypothetical protein
LSGKLEGEVVFGVAGRDGEFGKNSEVSGLVSASSVFGVGEVKAGGFEAGLEVGEVFEGSDFTNAENVGLLGDDLLDESFDFLFWLAPELPRTVTDVTLHGEVVFDIEGKEADSGGGFRGSERSLCGLFRCYYGFFLRRFRRDCFDVEGEEAVSGGGFRRFRGSLSGLFRSCCGFFLRGFRWFWGTLLRDFLRFAGGAQEKRPEENRRSVGDFLEVREAH